MNLNWYTMIPSESDLEFWIKNKYNVLFVGGHGIGKTAIVKQAFAKANLKNRYFSASTMDPWVDFIGVPKEQHDENGAFLDLVKPKDFRDDCIEALFFDEYNRAPSKVQNAVMELIQFKSINGRKFDNLNIIWAAINENSEDEDDEYAVEKLDYAQLDRFHVIVKLPSKPQVSFFKKKYGSLGTVAVNWWDTLSPELKRFISPRRLDYVLDFYKHGGDIRQCLPDNANVKTLISNLKTGLPYEVFVNLLNEKDEFKLKLWIRNEKNLSQIESLLVEKHLPDFYEFLSDEKKVQMFTKYENVRSYLSENYSSNVDLLKSISKSTNHTIKQLADQIIMANDENVDISTKWSHVTLVRAQNYHEHLFSKAFDYSLIESRSKLITLDPKCEHKDIDVLFSELRKKYVVTPTQKTKVLHLEEIINTLSDIHLNTVTPEQLVELMHVLSFILQTAKTTQFTALAENSVSAKLLSYIAKYIVYCKDSHHITSTQQVYNDIKNVALYVHYSGVEWHK